MSVWKNQFFWKVTPQDCHFLENPSYIYHSGYLLWLFWNFSYIGCSPVKNLSCQLIHWELTLKLMVSSFWGHSVSSQWAHKMTHIELVVSTPWVCNSCRGLTVSCSWDHPDELTMQWYQWTHCELVSFEFTMLAHCDLKVISHGEIFRWALCEYRV